MKKSNFLVVLIILNFPLIGFSQYSNYYKVDVNSKSEVKLHGKVEVDQTITTIDYGALSLAEAQKEKNRLQSKIYKDATQKQQSLEIAGDPLKAFDYGEDVSFNTRQMNGMGGRSIAKSFGFTYVTFYHKEPNTALFIKFGDKYSYINESLNGVTTIIDVGSVSSVLTKSSFTELNNKEKKEIRDKWEPFFGDSEKYIFNKYNYQLGLNNENTKDEFFLHKKDFKKAMIWGYEGFVCSLIYETKYEFVIREEFVSLTNSGFLAKSTVTYKGDKNNITFENLESRRAYLGGLARKLISTAQISNFKLNND